MTSPQYAKQLGREGQKKVKEILLRRFPHLENDDIYSRPMGSPGEDLMLSPRARKVLPFDIEVKYGKQINLIRACQQASVESRNKKYTPLSVGCYRLEKPHQWYCCLKLEDFLKLLVCRVGD
jgi:hypothetical protein